MAINFDSLPTAKPSNNTTVTEGRHLARVEKAEMTTSKTSDSKYLKVTFKTKDGGYVTENYFEGDKPFLLYKIGRLLKATGVVLEGTGSLEDIAKLIKGKKVTIDVALNDRGYGTLDYTDAKEGIYARDEVVTEEVNEVEEIDTDIEEAVASEDDDF